MTEHADQSKTPAHPALGIAGVVGAAGGWALSSYVGANLWIPALAGLLLGLLFAKTRLRPPHFAAAVAVTGAHAIWMLAGAFFTGQWGPVMVDVVAMLAAIVLIWARPSLTTALVLGLLQLAALGYNLYVLFQTEISSPMHRALTMHVVLRVIAVVAVVVGLRLLRNPAPAADPAGSPPR